MLAVIWKDVLTLSGIGVDDNFLNFGGNSLDATRITTQVRDELDLALGVANIFGYHTVADPSTGSWGDCGRSENVTWRHMINTVAVSCATEHRTPDERVLFGVRRTMPGTDGEEFSERNR